MSRVVFQIDDFDLLQTIFPFRSHHVIRKQFNIFNLHGRPVRDKLLPVLFGWIGHGRRHHAEVLRAFIGAKVEKVAAMIDVVFMVCLARYDYFPGGVRIICREVAKLR